jgi:hypothetical protein
MENKINERVTESRRFDSTATYYVGASQVKPWFETSCASGAARPAIARFVNDLLLHYGHELATESA